MRRLLLLPPARLLRAKPSRLEGGAPVPALRRGRAASRGRRASRSAPIRTVRAHGGAPGLGVGRRAYGCCALILASATSANLGCPCFPEPSCSSPRPRDISALLDWTRSRLNSAIPRRHRRRRLLSRREQSRRRWRRRSRRAAGRAAALARRIAGRGLLAPLASPPQQAEDRARRREERLDVGPCVLVNPFISRSSLLPSSERLDVVCACLDLAHGQADLARLLTARGVRRRRPHLDSRPPRHAPAPRRWPRPQGR